MSSFWFSIQLGTLNNMKIIFSIVCILFTLSNPSIAQSKDLKILFDDRRPYYYTNEDGSIGGIIGARVDQALRNANIDAEWVRVPSNRQLVTIERDSVVSCSPGWFKNLKRESFAKFSPPIYQDQPQVIVHRANAKNQFNHSSLAKVFADQQLVFGAKKSYSYGIYVDKLIELHSPNSVTTYRDKVGMVEMLLKHRFDYFISAPEEFNYLSEKFGLTEEGITSTALSDFPKGNLRYLMCSKSVDDDTIRRFSEAFNDLYDN